MTFLSLVKYTVTSLHMGVRVDVVNRGKTEIAVLLGVGVRVAGRVFVGEGAASCGVA
jgi:hypothetical protein